MSEMERIALAIAKGGLFGSGDPNAVLTLCMVAQAEGKHPAQVMQDYDIIKGKPAKKAQAMVRDFLQAGGKVTWNRLDDECADATFSHPVGGEVTINWTIARAQKAQLTAGDNWKKYPRAMLRSRVVSEGVRTVFPSATSGMYVPEEVADFDDSPRSNTPPTPEPKRARDLAAEQPKAIETKPDAKRAKAEHWLAWLVEEVAAAGGEVEAVQAIFADAQPTLAKIQTEFPDLYAEAMRLAPTDDSDLDAHPAQNRADEIIAELRRAQTLIDLRRIKDEAQGDIDAMPEAVAEAVASAFSREEKRLKTQPESAK